MNKTDGIVTSLIVIVKVLKIHIKVKNFLYSIKIVVKVLARL